MATINYWQFPGFENVYLEDSYVLGIKAQGSVVEILIEAVLTENHPLYTPPLPGEQYCYRQMTIKFPLPQNYTLVNKMRAISGGDGRVDYGNIEEFYRNEQQSYIRGEWGELRIISEVPVMMANHLSLIRPIV
ncbi:hypothetical protein [[Phormidium] sp. ETS-05]|uniref:hypothetical protein n=1 Tax=[Phormidium] sp. ETS-05 TaxID=222819 RepID=UPI0018EF325F|nr:hypothetical protein [[Phormidium] sp. ETS-05]